MTRLLECAASLAVLVLISALTLYYMDMLARVARMVTP